MKFSDLKKIRQELDYDLGQIALFLKVRISMLSEIEDAPDDKIWSTTELLLLKKYCDLIGVDFSKLEINLHKHSLHNVDVIKKYDQNYILYSIAVISIVFFALLFSLRYSEILDSAVKTDLVVSQEV